MNHCGDLMDIVSHEGKEEECIRGAQYKVIIKDVQTMNQLQTDHTA